jgi:hypothetical protein
MEETFFFGLGGGGGGGKPGDHKKFTAGPGFFKIFYFTNWAAQKKKKDQF